MVQSMSIRLGKELLDCADVEVRSAVRSQSAKNICGLIMGARILLKLALREHEKELDHESQDT